MERAQGISRRSSGSLKRLLESLEFALTADASETLAIETAVRSLVHSAQEQLQLIADLKMYLVLHDFKAMLAERDAQADDRSHILAEKELMRYFAALESQQDFRRYEVRKQ